MKTLLISAGLLALVGSVHAASVPPKSPPSFVPGKYRTVKSAQSVATLVDACKSIAPNLGKGG